MIAEEEYELQARQEVEISQYKQLINTAFCKARDCKGYAELVSHIPSIRIFQSQNQQYYKLESLIHKPAFHVYQLCTDNHYETRSKWDVETIRNVQTLEHYDDITLVYYLFSSKRCMLGIQWERYNNIKQTYTIVFKSINDKPHPRYNMPENHKSIDCMAVTFIKHIDENTCFVSQIIDNHGMGVDKLMLLKRFHLLETTVNDTIFRMWTCQERDCLKDNEPHLLECRFCGKNK